MRIWRRAKRGDGVEAGARRAPASTAAAPGDPAGQPRDEEASGALAQASEAAIARLAELDRARGEAVEALRVLSRAADELATELATGPGASLGGGSAGAPASAPAQGESVPRAAGAQAARPARALAARRPISAAEARQVAIELAAAGAVRAEVEAHLRGFGGVDDPRAVLDEVFGAASGDTARVPWAAGDQAGLSEAAWSLYRATLAPLAEAARRREASP